MFNEKSVLPAKIEGGKGLTPKSKYDLTGISIYDKLVLVKLAIIWGLFNP